MKTSSIYQSGRVRFAPFTGERVYMHGFTKAAGLPPHLQRWQDTVDAMLEGVDTHGPIFLMVDQARVKTGSMQRRPGIHIDGHWNPSIRAHGQEPPGHDHRPNERDRAVNREAIILASNTLGCTAYAGIFEGDPGDGGDFGHIDVGMLERIDMEPDRVWVGDAAQMLHESLPVGHDCLRTVVRLNVQGWTPSPLLL